MLKLLMFGSHLHDQGDEETVRKKIEEAKKRCIPPKRLYDPASKTDDELEKYARAPPQPAPPSDLPPSAPALPLLTILHSLSQLDTPYV